MCGGAWRCDDRDILTAVRAVTSISDLLIQSLDDLALGVGDSIGHWMFLGRLATCGTTISMLHLLAAKGEWYQCVVRWLGRTQLSRRAVPCA